MNDRNVKKAGISQRVRLFVAAVVLVLSFAVLRMATGIGVFHTRHRPKESDLVGLYRPNLKTRILIQRETKSPATNCFIKLHGNGKIEFVNVGHWTIGEPDTNLPAVNLNPTNVTWQLQEYEGDWHIGWSYDHVSGDGLQLVGEKPPYTIQISTWQTRVPFYFVQERN